MFCDSIQRWAIRSYCASGSPSLLLAHKVPGMPLCQSRFPRMAGPHVVVLLSHMVKEVLTHCRTWVPPTAMLASGGSPPTMYPGKPLPSPTKLFTMENSEGKVGFCSAVSTGCPKFCLGMRRTGLASWKPYCTGCGILASSLSGSLTPKAVACVNVTCGLSWADSCRPQSKRALMESIDETTIFAIVTPSFFSTYVLENFLPGDLTRPGDLLFSDLAGMVH